jgi:hypothetical protein
MQVKVLQKNQKKIKRRQLKNFSFKNKSPEKNIRPKAKTTFSVGVIPRIVDFNHGN